MKVLQVGDKVVVINVPQFISFIYKLRGGEIGEVIKMCTCLTCEDINGMDVSDQVKDLLRRTNPHRIDFGGAIGKICVPRRYLRKIEDDEGDGLVDWSKVPKPWEIGVKS